MEKNNMHYGKMEYLIINLYSLNFNNAHVYVCVLEYKVWRVGPMVRLLDSESGDFSRGGSTPGLGKKNIYGML